MAVSILCAVVQTATGSGSHLFAAGSDSCWNNCGQTQLEVGAETDQRLREVGAGWDQRLREVGAGRDQRL